MAKVTFSSEVKWDRVGVRSTAHINDKTVVIDEPPSLGGTDEGPNPVELVLAGLGGCLNVLISLFAEQHDVELHDVTTTVKGELDPDGFLEKSPVRTGFQSITYTINVVSPSDRENVKALIAHAERVCPVKDTLQGVPVHAEVVTSQPAAS